MIVINRLCRSNANKCLINYISTTVTARCEKPEGEEKSAKKKDDGINEERKSEGKSSLKKISELFEDNISEQKRKEAKERLKAITLKLTPVSKTVTVTQKEQPEMRPVDEAAKKAQSRLEYNLVQSAKRVADEFGGDVKKTDGDLLKALNKFLDNTATEPKKTEKEEKLLKEGETEESHVKPDITRVDVTSSKGTKRLKGILSGINKVSKQKITYEEEADLKFFDLINNSDGLNIFYPGMERNGGLKLKLWDELQRDELKFITSSSPRNYFEELIKWTEEGKLWHFPINNEQGMDEEASVDFSEHVFLEDYLEPWCPKSGPLRHFMELVCVGLSKNPYLTVADKREHIYWFRDYFEEKKRILQELGALASRKEIEKPNKTEEKLDTE